jgi:flavin-dependent dehydrogenase
VEVIYDLAVIGAGPAGAAAAITAARMGHRVLLLERGGFPRHRVCGEFVSAESLQLLANLLGDGSLLQNAVRVHAARTYLDGRIIRHRVEPPAAGITRFDLDHALWQAASSAGATCRDHCEVRAIRQDEDGFRVEAANGAFHARCVIQAAGRWSNLTQPAVPPGPKWLGLKAHFSEASPARSVDLYFFPGGYCGVQPIGDSLLNVCSMVRANAARNLAGVFSSHAELEKRSRTWRQVTETVTTSPLIFHAPTPVRNGIMLAGDAANFIDPFAGDGIATALLSGELAARHVDSFLRGETSRAESLAAYDRDYRRAFEPAIRNARRIRRLLDLPSAVRRLPALALQLPGTADWLVRMTRARPLD